MTIESLVALLGSILILLLGLLISMMRDLKKDLRCTKDMVIERVKIPDCTKKNDDVWKAIVDLQKIVWGGDHEK